MTSKHDSQHQLSTRERILVVASRLFAEKGYAATSVRDIAAELGIANPSLYYHFKSKGDILKELLSEPLQRVESAIQDAEILSGEARVRRILRGLLESLEVHSGIAVTAFQQGERIPEEYTTLATSQQHHAVTLLAEYADGDNQNLKVTMAIAGVQGIVHELLRSSKDADDFVVRLRDKREFIIDLVLRILSSSE